MFSFWPDNYTWSYQLVRALAEAHFGGGDIGEILATAAAITPGDAASWKREWLRTADDVAALAAQATGPATEDAWKRASNYLRMASFFLPHGDPDEPALYRRGAEAFRRGVPGIEAVRIPFEGRAMHAFFATPPDSAGRMPTLILLGGLESLAEEVYFVAGVAALRYGFACLVLEGPGQGATLREEGLASRAAYEAPIAAAVDYLQARPEVDAERIGMVAYSLGGYYVCRAAAFERRLRACVAWGAEYDYSEVWDGRPDDHPLAPHLMGTLGVATMPEARRILRDFHLRGVASRIESPLLILHGADDRHIPLSHARRTYEEARGPKELKIFPAGQPGSIHCQWDAPTRAHAAMFSFLRRHLMPAAV
jgi:dienelactone hydrolase